MVGTVTGTDASTTLDAYDTVDLGAGTDTVVANFAGTDPATINIANIPTLNGVEIFQIKAASFDGGVTLTHNFAPDLTTLNETNQVTAGTLTVASLGAAVTTIGLTDKNIDDSDLVVGYASGALGGTADALSLNLSNVAAVTKDAANSTDIDISGAAGGYGYETVNLAITGTNRIADLTIDDGTNSTMTTLNISGTGSLKNFGTLDFKSGSAGTIDASANSGGVTLTVGTEDNIFIDGSGDDYLTFLADGDFDNADSVSFSNGGTDTLSIDDIAISTAEYAMINATGAEVIAFTAADGESLDVDMSKLDAHRIILNNAASTAGDNTITKLSADDTVVINATAGEALETNVAAALGYNTLNLEFNGGTTGAAEADVVTATGQSVINIYSTGSNGNSIDNLVSSANASIVITGDKSFELEDALDDASSVDATGLTAALTVTGGDAASIFKGGTKADTITLGTQAGGDTVEGGAGNDTITSAVTDAATGTTSITGGLGTDTIHFQDAGLAGDSTATINATAAESYATAGKYDLVIFDAAVATNDWTVTINTGLSATTVTAATSVTLGTTTITAGQFLWVNASGSASAQDEDAMLYQDTDGDGVIEATDFAMSFDITGADTTAVAIEY
jgi:hypothetical protein